MRLKCSNIAGLNDSSCHFFFLKDGVFQSMGKTIELKAMAMATYGNFCLSFECVMKLFYHTKPSEHHVRYSCQIGDCDHNQCQPP